MQTEKQKIETLETIQTFFNAQQVDKLIVNTEKELTAALVRLNEQTPAFREIEELYKLELFKFESVGNEVNDLKAILETLGRYRHKLRSSKEMRVLRTTSHTAKPEKEIARIAWKNIFLTTLAKCNRFLTAHELFDIAAENYEVIKDGMKRNSNFRGSNINYAKRLAENNHSDFCVYKNHIGLTAWIDGSCTPLPLYMKPFLYKH